MPSERLHPWSFLFSAGRIARAFIVPAGVAGVGGGGGDPASVITILLWILAVPSLLWGLADYLLFRFRLGDDALVVDSGVISRRRRMIRPHRIQNVELRQGALQRVLGVAEVRVETAGAGDTEVVISVLRAADAQALRERLLERRGAARPAGEADAPAVQPLARLGSRDLLVAGATANEAGLLAAAIAGAFQFAEGRIFEAFEARLADGTLERIAAAGTWLVVVSVIVFVLLLGWVISMVGAVVGYHDFTLERAGGDLRKRHGLLGRTWATIPLARVQAVRIEESLLRRPFGLASIKVSTAGRPGREGGRAEVLLPILRRADAGRLVAAVFAELRLDDVQLVPVHPRAQRKLLVRGLVTVALIAAVWGLWTGQIWYAAAGLPVAVLAAWDAYRARGYIRAGNFAITRAGVWNRVTWIVPLPRVQSVHITQSPIQRYQKLASVVVDTAGGGKGKAAALDLGAADAAAWAESVKG